MTKYAIFFRNGKAKIISAKSRNVAIKKVFDNKRIRKFSLFKIKK